MTLNDFRFRQVHLDFHTSPLIPDVGGKFDKREFQEALKIAHVDSITLFSKCHHGYSYHPTKVNRMHPTLSFDLLGAQLEACGEIGVRAPVYLSAGFDEKDAVTHRDWLYREFGTEGQDFSKPGFHLLCYNTPYLDKLLAEIAEVMERYHPCGIFLDISAERTCCCDRCTAGMKELGLDPRNYEDVKKYGRLTYRHYAEAVEKLVRSYSKTATIFHNAGHIARGRRDLVRYDTHLELESLPTGGWGYDHFPMSAAYARTLHKDFLGMTGKFHKTWGEFGGFKHPNALKYEAALSIANGAGCSIGSQCHPSGKLNRSTAALIGAAYAFIEPKEPWCRGYENVADVAVLSAEACGVEAEQAKSSDTGANRILLESHMLYNFIDQEEDFGKYRLILCPDRICVTPALRAKLERYLQGGGKLLLSGRSGLDADGKFALDAGVAFAGENEFSPTYLVPDKIRMTNGVTEYLMRARSWRFRNLDAEILASGQNPYFNRTREHFCSHQHAPNDPRTQYPTVAVKGSVAYIGWDVFSGYARYGDLQYKELVRGVIGRLMGGDGFSAKAEVPDRAVVTLTRKENREVLHLLFAHTTIRGADTEVIEDVVPLYNVKCSVKCGGAARVYTVPDQKDLPFAYRDGYAAFTVPEVRIHSMVCIETSAG